MRYSQRRQWLNNVDWQWLPTAKLGDLGATEDCRFTTFFITPLCGAAAAAAAAAGAGSHSDDSDAYGEADYTHLCRSKPGTSLRVSRCVRVHFYWKRSCTCNVKTPVYYKRKIVTKTSVKLCYRCRY